MTSDLPVLAGLDDVDWASLEHAYGPATDVPDVLRALAGGDEEQADEALYELHGNIWHQGSVYPATVEAVPFLVETALARAAGTRTADVLRLLGRLAESRDPRGIEDPDAVRSAVAAYADALATLLDDPEDATRAAALFALVHSAEAERVRPLILQCWNAETDVLARAEVLHAMTRVDAEAAADLADQVLSTAPSGDAVLRVSSALAWIRAGRAVDERVLTAALAPIPEDLDFGNWIHAEELFDALVAELAERQGVRASNDLLMRALAAEEAGRFLSSVRELIVGYRSASETLAEPLALMLDHPDLARRAVDLLALIRPAVAAPVARDRLVALAAAEAEPGTDDAALADDALACLAGWHDPIVPGLLARALTDRPQTLDAVAGFTTVPDRPALPFDDDLLAAIRRRLNEIHDDMEAAPSGDNPFAALRDRNEPGQLAGILASWGARAEPAVPELSRLLTSRPIAAAQALAAIGTASPECHAALRQVTRSAGEDNIVRARIEVARAIRTLTHDAGPLLDAVQFGLTVQSKSPDDRSAAASAAMELPEHADLLVPLLRAALEAISLPTPSLPAHQARLQLGRTLWQLTAEPEHAVDVLHGTLELVGESLVGWTVARAADLAAELGPSARGLAPRLEEALADPISVPAAARALLAVDPEGPWPTTRREELADLLISALIEGRVPATRHRALDVLAELAPLPPKAAERLRVLAEQDERLPLGVQDSAGLRSDDRLFDRARTLVRPSRD